MSIEGDYSSKEGGLGKVRSREDERQRKSRFTLTHSPCGKCKRVDSTRSRNQLTDALDISGLGCRHINTPINTVYTV